MNKRGISGVITTLLFLLIALGAVLLVWNLVKGIIVKTGSELDTSLLTANLEIVSAKIDPENQTASILVKRNIGEGEIKGLNVILEDENGNSISREVDLEIDELETKRVIINYSGEELGEIIKVSIAPVLLFSSGKDAVSSVTSSIDVSLEESSGGGVVEEPDIPIDNLLLVLKFEEGTGLPVENSVSGIGPFTSNPESILGKSGNAMKLDTVDKDYIKTAGKTGEISNGKTEMSASFWFNMPGHGGQIQHVVLFEEDGDALGWLRYKIYLTSSQQVVISVTDSSSKSSFSPSGFFSFGEWHHAVVVIDTINDKVAFYIDGVKAENSFSMGALSNSPTEGHLYIGANSHATAGTQNHFNGIIDELYVWDRVLTDAEVSELYNSGEGNFY